MTAAGTTTTPLTTGFEKSVVAAYQSHEAAEEAVRQLERGGIPIRNVSIIGRDWQVREDVQGYYRPADAALEGAGAGAWFGGLFGLLVGFGFFLFPVVGPLFVLGPLAGLVGGAVVGAGLGALIDGLMALGMSRDEALKYQSRLQAGEFLLVVQGTQEQAERARQILLNTGHIAMQMHDRAA